MLPSNGDQYPEIDIMEFLGQELHQIWHVEHYLKKSKYTRQYTSINKRFDFSKDYHVYGLEWSSKKVTWFLDGKKTFSTNDYSPSIKMYLYINTAVGGVWATDPNQTNVFPQIMNIDYVRVYTKF